ncbi:MAG: desulfoferrodoxin [Phycisphaerae bacterium]|nr:desulfoferrodoxin [Phycisphaerae bacterium]
MTERLAVYRCPLCGNVVEVLHAGVGQLICCGRPMLRLAQSTAESRRAMHEPVVERTADALRVTVGCEPHPMEDKHQIEWIEVRTDTDVFRRFLAPGQRPELELPAASGDVTVVAYCNVHGIWRNQA